MPRTDAKRFDHHFKAFQEDGGKLQRHVQAGLREFRHAKQCAYRMTKAYLAIIAKYQNQLLDFARSEGKTIDEWLDRWFLPMGSLGDDYRDLIAAVDKGMTLNAFLAKTPAIFLAEQRRKSIGESGDVPMELPLPAVSTAGAEDGEPEGDEGPSPEESAELWKVRCLAAEAQLKDVRGRLRESDRRCAKLEKAVKGLHRTINAAVAA